MVDYSKWDAFELSDDSDIEVHPKIDKRSFIRAKQHQIHMERQQRKRQIQALKHERVINDALMQRLRVLASALQSRHAGSAHSNLNPADIAFQAMMELASTKPEEDSPPPRPEGVFDADLPPLPTYSKMLATILDEVNKTLDERRTEKDQRHEAFAQELGVHVRKIQDLQAELVNKLDTLEQQDSNKINSESYHVGFDSSYVSKTKPGETSKQETKVELLNPNYNLDETKLDARKKAATDDSGDSEQKIRASPAAKIFAQIPASDYRASRDYLYSHPEILQKESETDGLFIEAYYAMLDQNDERRAWQYVHQALLLQYCHMLGRDGVALFFKRITTLGHQAREVFEKDVAERFQKIRSMAKRDPSRRMKVSIRIQVPPAGSEDEEVRKARKIFEQFSPEMRAALESGSLEEVNKVLAEMAVSEAEKMVGLLDEAGCLSIEDEIIDATTGEGKRYLWEMEEAAVADAEPAASAMTARTEATSDSK
ncbi:Cdc37 N terminal kinase binding-domain-containing protein [Diplogelasinospora grovesii]|uniref:Hsp90 chaperone protein kinase-targeting subunit n=1 Tax=Diplogelasinospora grovesii TaxID=303347 RepID=A0AAN6MWU4_9PEZI|nr:Cdc37 N terminal kinase binding-domain-containing protein [Diplogelasinospora grovesii]